MRFLGLRYPLAALLLTTTLQAQSTDVSHRTTKFWLTGGAGHAWTSNKGDIVPGDATAWALAASVQRGILVGSIRTAQYTRFGHSGWDAGVLLGAGSPARYSFWGSVGAGVGISENNRGENVASVPLELQLGWRFSPNIGLASYLFGSLGGSNAFGATLGLQVGRLH
jgi:hypothetical protein